MISKHELFSIVAIIGPLFLISSFIVSPEVLVNSLRAFFVVYAVFYLMYMAMKSVNNKEN